MKKFEMLHCFVGDKKFQITIIDIMDGSKKISEEFVVSYYQGVWCTAKHSLLW